MQWYKHSTSSHDDPDIMDAWDIYGEFAYTSFFMILEIYGQEFNGLSDGWLTISQTFLKRKLRKSWTKVELLLNFYQERKRILYSTDYGKVKIKIPKFIDLASNWSKRKPITPTEVTTEAPTAKNRIEEKKNRKENSIKEIAPWKNDFEIYKKLLYDAMQECLKDNDWIKIQESDYSNIDVVKSLNKSLRYWSSESVWKKVKKKRTGEKINMVMWFQNNFDKNRIYKSKFGDNQCQTKVNTGPDLMALARQKLKERSLDQ